MKFITLDQVDSTNAYAKRLTETGECGPLWIRADQQSAGRGRRGREWVSEVGNLYCSGLFPHQGSPQEAAEMSFVAALAVAETLNVYVNQEKITLKWPNDVLVDGKKISGILLESGRNWFIMGIGINLTTHPKETETIATHLGECLAGHSTKPDNVKPPDAHEVLKSLSVRFSNWRDIYVNTGFLAIKKAWMNWASNIPGPVRVRLAKEEFEGQALGLNENGALRVRLENGTIRDIHAGDIFFGAQGA